MARVSDASISFFWDAKRKTWSISWRAEGRGGIVKAKTSAPIDQGVCLLLAHRCAAELEAMLPF